MLNHEQCPNCKGSGHTGPVHINRGDRPHEWRESIECDFCQGTGKVDQDKIAAQALGKRFRKQRLARNESLLEAARRLGLKPSELSSLEHGRGGMAAWYHPWATSAYYEAIVGEEKK